MRKLFTVCAVLAAFSAVHASPVEQQTDFKRCFKRCMKQLDDKEKCEYICDDNIKPAGM